MDNSYFDAVLSTPPQQREARPLSRRTRTMLVAMLAAGAVFWAGLAWGQGSTSTASCPTEDSCVVDYRDGAWHIEEVTP